MRFAVLVHLVILALAGAAVASRAGEAAPEQIARTADASQQWAESTLARMSLEEKVGQLFMIKAEVEPMNPAGAAYARLRDAMLRCHVGGFLVTVPVEGGLLVKPSPLDAAALTNQLQRDSPLPLIFAADFERGLTMRFSGGTGFPHAMAIGATGNPEYAYQFGRITAAEGRAIGIHWNFYPDADVNSNPANPIINTRAFGEDPAEVGAMVAAFIRGAHDGGGMATAKHFPGHGDTDTDSHLALSRINASRARLDRIELVPFRAAIAAGVDSVMIGHLLVPALEPDPNRPATISYNITTRLLRDELGFQGIAVTDAMDMNGLTRIFEASGGVPGAPAVGGLGWNGAQSAGRAAVAALQAGADLILVPGDLDGAYNGVLAAVRSGELSESRIDQSVARLLRAKAALGLDRNRFVDLNAVPSALGLPENLALAQQMADDAVTVVREGGPQAVAEAVTDSSHHTKRNGSYRESGAPNKPVSGLLGWKLLPLPRGSETASPFAYHAAVAAGNHLLVLVFSDDVRSENGRVLVREIRSRVPDARVLYIDDTLASALAPEVREAVARAERIVAAIYVIPTAGRAVAPALANGATGSPGLARGSASLLASVLRTASARTVVIALGNPYLISQYPAVENYVCTFSNMPVSELSAVKFLFGEIPARGHLPITIPDVAERVPMPTPQQPISNP